MPAAALSAPATDRDESWPPKRLTDLLCVGAERFPTWSLSDGQQSIGFAELEDRASRLAGGMTAWGVRQGDHVALWMDNDLSWLDVWFATAGIGAVLVPLNTRFTPDEAAFVLSASDSRWLIKGGAGLDRTVGSDLQGVAAIEPTEHETSLADLADGEPVESREQPGQIGMIQYTSGSTAFPKGVLLRSESLIRNGWGLGRAWQLDETDRVLCANPLFHCGGSVFAFMSAATSGSPLRLMPRWRLDSAIEIIQNEGITIIPGIDAMVRDLVAHTKATQQKLPSLRLISTAADRNLFEGVAEHIGANVSNVYGLTECSTNVCVGDLQDPEELRLERIGRPQPGLQVDIRDPQTNETRPTNQIGEIVVRGWSLMEGYYKDPVATASVTTDDGYLRTGDLGSVDEDGYMSFEGRLKQMIKSGGENIAIAEVEATLRRHSNVADAVVVPVPHERFGEVGFAFVVPVTEGTLDADELIKFCKQDLAGFKVPKHVTILSELPHTGSGKLDRKRLQEQATQTGRTA